MTGTRCICGACGAHLILDEPNYDGPRHVYDHARHVWVKYQPEQEHQAELRAVEQEGNELRAEVRRLRESVKNLDALYCGMGAHLRDAHVEVERLRHLLRDVAERQREACAAACEAWDNDFAHTYADVVRETPLVTETKP